MIQRAEHWSRTDLLQGRMGLPPGSHFGWFRSLEDSGGGGGGSHPRQVQMEQPRASNSAPAKTVKQGKKFNELFGWKWRGEREIISALTWGLNPTKRSGPRAWMMAQEWGEREKTRERGCWKNTEHSHSSPFYTPLNKGQSLKCPPLSTLT